MSAARAAVDAHGGVVERTAAGLVQALVPVAGLEALGSEIVVHFSIDAKIVDAGDSDTAAIVKRVGQANSVGRFDPRSRVRPGDVAEIAVNTGNLHFFDPQTQLNLRA